MSEPPPSHVVKCDTDSEQGSGERGVFGGGRRESNGDHIRFPRSGAGCISCSAAGVM